MTILKMAFRNSTNRPLKKINYLNEVSFYFLGIFDEF